jgi:hypothetical protein
LEPLAIEQIWAGRGLPISTIHDLVKRLTANGGVIDLFGSGCYTGPAGYTAGSFNSPQERYRMWQLAGYYVLKEPSGRAGRVFFDPTFWRDFQPGRNYHPT